jgi:hypothetical protein
MSAIVAYRRFLSRQPNNHSWKRFYENEAARKACRGRAKNSNAAIDRCSVHSGIIAAMNPATVEFSLQNWRSPDWFPVLTAMPA